MNPALEGQVVLVTGGSSGIVCGVAQALANAGASVSPSIITLTARPLKRSQHR
ncbi:MAG: hypothetical protein CBARDCOR_4473 [uncultured Caballeronia sp.]|nr:MAG: hypothetical protein CBARDCOR_4473 [uncultured Caballeronia sp.]